MMQKILLQQAEQIQRQTQHLREIEKHAATDKIVQAAQVYTSYKSLKDNDKMVTEIADLTKATEEGLIKKTGDGLNSNIIKLTDEMRKAFRSKQNAVKEARKDAQPVDDNALDRARAQAAKYQMGGKGYLKDKYKVTGLKDVGKAFKGMFSLEKIFDLEDGKSQGLLGQIIRAKVAKDKYIENQLKTGAAPNKEVAGRQYEVVNKYRGELSDTQKEMERRKAEGASEDDLKKEGYYARMEKAERAIAIADPNYRMERAKDIDGQKVVPMNPAEKVSTLSAGTSSEESENENIRLMNEQNESLTKIEENTRPLGDIMKFLEKSFEDLLKVMKEKASQGDGDGGVGLVDMLGNRIPGRGRGRPAPGKTPGRTGPGKTPGKAPGRWPAPSGPTSTLPSRAPGRWPAPSGPTSPLPRPGGAPGGLLSRAGGLLGRAGPLAANALRFAGPAAAVAGAGLAGYQVGTAAYNFASDAGLTRPAEALIDKAFGNDPNESFDKGMASNMAKKNAALKGSGYTATEGGYKAPDGKVIAAKDLPPELKGKLNALKIPGLNIPEATKASATAPAPKAGDAVANTSASNAAAKDQKASAPVVVSAPTSTNIQQTSNYAPKYPARNSDSSIQQYNKSRYGY